MGSAASPQPMCLTHFSRQYDPTQVNLVLPHIWGGAAGCFKRAIVSLRLAPGLCLPPTGRQGIRYIVTKLSVAITVLGWTQQICCRKASAITSLMLMSCPCWDFNTAAGPYLITGGKIASRASPITKAPSVNFMMLPLYGVTES